MTTKFIGIKDFRQNIAKYAKAAQAGKARYVVMNRTKPLFEISPFDEDEDLSSFYVAIREGVEDMKRGRLHSEKEILAEFAA